VLGTLLLLLPRIAAAQATGPDPEDDGGAGGGQITIVLGSQDPAATISVLNRALATAQSSLLNLSQEVANLQRTIQQLQGANDEAAASAQRAQAMVSAASRSAEAARASIGVVRVCLPTAQQRALLHRELTERSRPMPTRAFSRPGAMPSPSRCSSPQWRAPSWAPWPYGPSASISSRVTGAGRAKEKETPMWTITDTLGRNLSPAARSPRLLRRGAGSGLRTSAMP